MARILALPCGNFLSHVSRPLEVAKALRARGHEVVFAGEGRFLGLAADAGFITHPLVTPPAALMLERVRNGSSDWFDPPMLLEHVGAERALYARLRPDLILADMRASARISANLAGIPLAVILNAAWTNYDAFPYDYTRLGFLAPGVTDPATLERIILERRDQSLLRAALPFHEVCRELGLPFEGNLFDVWAGDLTLIADIPQYGPTRDPPPHFHTIGPLTWEPDLPGPEWLERLDPGRPTLYITMGSTGHEQAFEWAMRRFGGSELQCIVTTGAQPPPPDPPGNFHFAGLVPGSVMMRRADAVLCQGGNGTIYQALAAGIPIAGLPTMSDQYLNLERVEALGLGFNVTSLARLGPAIEALLHDGRYRAAAGRFASILAGYDAPRSGAALIEEFMREKRKPAPGACPRGGSTGCDQSVEELF